MNRSMTKERPSSRERSTTKDRSATKDRSTTRERSTTKEHSTTKDHSSSRNKDRSPSRRSSASSSSSKSKKRHRSSQDTAYPAESDAEAYDHPMDDPADRDHDRQTTPPPAAPRDDPRAVWKMVQISLNAHDEAMRRREEAWARRQEALQEKEEAWARRQDERLATWRREEEERAAARDKEARDAARRAAEWEKLMRSHQPTPSGPQTAPKTNPPPEDEDNDEYDDIADDDHDRGHSDEEDMREPQGPLDAPQPDAPPYAPADDHSQFADLMLRAAANFGVQMHKVEEPESFLLNKLGSSSKASNQLPIDKHIWKKGLEVLRKPASVPATYPRQEKYRVPAADPLCLHGVPPPDSTVATAARKKAASSSLSAQAGPPEREHRRLDTVGKKICATASLTIREANTSAMLARYDRDMWDEMEEYVKRLPVECRQGAMNTIAEGRLCANHGVKTALDLAEAAFHSMAHGVTMRRHGWLQGSGFKTDIQGRLLDMPFDGQQLFGKEVEEAISKTKGELEATKVAELQQQQPKKKPFHPYPSSRQQNRPRRGRPWPPTRGYGNSRGQSKRGRGASHTPRPAPKDKA